MKNDQKSKIESLTDNYLYGRNFVVGKTISIKKLLGSIQNIENNKIMDETLLNLKRAFNKKVRLVLTEDKVPMVLNLIITVFADNEIEINEENVSFLISKIQKYVFLQYNDFYLVESFLKIAKIKLFMSGKIKDKELALEVVNTEKLIKQHSKAEQNLSADISGIYQKMDEYSKNLYRRKLSELSRLSKIGEEEVSEHILNCAGKRHIGEMLLDNPAFENRKKQIRKIYVFLVSILTIILSVITLKVTENAILSFFSLLLFLGPSMQLSEKTLIRFVSPTPIPRMDVKGKVPKNSETAVVVSAVLSENFPFMDIKEKILREYHKAPKGEIAFVLLCDLYENNRKKTEKDEELIEKARILTEDLNLETNGKMIFLLRRRTYSETMRCYIGKNRKRGAIEELIGFVNGKDVHFRKTFGSVDFLRKVKYLILLDIDTETSVGSVGKLVGVMCHPYNKPVIKNGKILRGRGIIAPVMTVPRVKQPKSLFGRIYSGQNCVSHYTPGSADIKNDLLGMNAFCGKGIVDAKAFYELTESAFKDEEVLSHDILEGLILNSAVSSDIVFYEGFPNTMESFSRRSDRWIRGDAQNLPFVMNTVKDRNYNPSKNPILLAGRIKLLENIYRALYPFVVSVALLSTYFLYSYKARVFFLLTSLSFLCTYLLNPNKASLKRMFFDIIFLPKDAFYNAKSFAVGLYRITYSKLNLLEWQTAHDSDNASLKVKLWLPCMVLGAFFLTSYKPYLRILGTLFLMSLVGIKFLRKETKPKTHNPTREEKHFLSVEQAKIWEYFSLFVNEKTNHLPPDNIKLEGSVKVDNRTSPTNIGLYLLSVWGAYEAELINREEMERRIKNTLETIEKLPKYKGHLYNWVNTGTLEVIPPRFVSSVDSGNFTASLTSLLAVTDGEIHERISKIIESTEWDFLYDSDKKLFYNGFNSEGATKSHYDMLMSECRILSYLAVSEGIVDAEHWKKLSRTSGKVKHKYGCLSYSGTAFEYFMPPLFQPIFENSIIDKSLSFCLSENKRFGRYFKIPFGVSESAFVGNGVIGYRAHGIHTLAVSETESGKTISPYSNYLFMQYDFFAAYKNYKRLKTFADGELGLYEAVDFSGNEPNPIKSYMSHHMGMSFLSLLNILNDNALQKAFMKDKKHRAFEELLWEDAVFIKE